MREGERVCKVGVGGKLWWVREVRSEEVGEYVWWGLEICVVGEVRGEEVGGYVWWELEVRCVSGKGGKG